MSIMSVGSLYNSVPPRNDEPDRLFNKVLNKLPFELHVPTYNFLGKCSSFGSETP